MSLSSADVRAVEFTLARRGYDERQVDDFLDQVVLAIDERDASVAETREQLAALRARAREDAPASAVQMNPEEDRQSAVDLLALAQRTAQEHMAAAEAAALELLESARQEAAETAAAARSQAARLLADAQMQHRDAIEELARRRDLLEQRITELRRLEEESRSELETYIGTLLDAVRDPGTSASSASGALTAVHA